MRTSSPRTQEARTPSPTSKSPCSHVPFDIAAYSAGSQASVANPRRGLHERPEAELQEPEGNVEYAGGSKRQLEADVTRTRRDWAHEPHLVDARYDQCARQGACAQRRKTGGQRAGVRPRSQVIRREFSPAHNEVLGENDRTEGGCPISDEAKEVGECVVELVCADDRDRDETAVQRWRQRGS